MCARVCVCTCGNNTWWDREFSVSLSLMANFIRYLFLVERKCGAHLQSRCSDLFRRRQTVFGHSVRYTCIPLTHLSMLQAQKKNKKLGSKSSVSSLRLSVFSLLSHLSISLSLSLMEEEGNGEGEGRCLMMLSLTVSIQQAAKGWQQHYKDWETIMREKFVCSVILVLFIYYHSIY